MMGVADPSEPKTNDLGHSWQFLDEVATRVCTVLPPMRRVRVIRQWSGSYDMTPDSQPILGRVPQLEGFYMAAGYSGHGFMMGPIIGELIADLMVGKEPSIDISMLDLGRFERGELVFEPSVV
jgi:sarcosine oxidase subunit beta